MILVYDRDNILTFHKQNLTFPNTVFETFSLPYTTA